MKKENRVIKEIAESRILTEYLIHHNLDFDDLSNFSNKMVKKAVVWFKNHGTDAGEFITDCLISQYDRREDIEEELD